MAERTALVVGGGIGGLAAAVALIRRGWEVTVCERAPEFTEVGTGLSLWPNALHALAALGLDGRVRELGSAEISGGVRDRAGRWLSRSASAELERRFGMPLLMLHRADLVRVLSGALPDGTLRPATTITGLRDEADGVVAEDERGGTLRAALVIGADGLHSTVRRLRWPEAEPPRYAGFTAWRMIAEPSGVPPGTGAVTWGRGAEFGFTSMPGGRFYCFGTGTVPEGGSSPDGERAELRRRFMDWPEPIPALLDAVPEDAVLRHDIYDLPLLRGYARGRVALLGDAAHAMVPNLGQGACQAIEDAVVLAACLDSAPGIGAALERYDRLRRRRTQRIVRRSAYLGAVSKLAWPPAVLARDLAVRMVPAAVTVRSMAPILGWRP